MASRVSNSQFCALARFDKTGAPHCKLTHLHPEKGSIRNQGFRLCLVFTGSVFRMGCLSSPDQLGLRSSLSPSSSVHRLPFPSFPDAMLTLPSSPLPALLLSGLLVLSLPSPPPYFLSNSCCFMNVCRCFPGGPDLPMIGALFLSIHLNSL